MSMKRWMLAGSVVSLFAIAPGCAVDDTASSEDNVTEHSLRGKWAVDMKKVDQHYGTSTSLFLGMTSEEAGIPAGLPGTEKTVWDLTARRLPDGSTPEETGNEIAVIDRDGNKIDPVGYVNIIPMLQDTDPADQVHIKKFLQNGDVIVYLHPEDSGNRGAMERRASHVAMHYEYTTADGRELVHHIDNPNGYGPRYNHAPNRHMPFNVYRFKPRAGDGAAGPASPAESVEGVAFTSTQRDKVLALVNSRTVEELDELVGLRKDAAENIVKMRELNGEFTSLTQLGLVPQVGPSALSTLRFSVGVQAEVTPISDADVAAYGEAAAGWAMMTNDRSPFADFFTLNLQKLEDLPAFAKAAVAGQDIPDVYCSGLAYVNLSLAINYPQNQAGLGDMWGQFASSKYSFSDANESLTAEQLRAASNLRGLNRLVFEPYGATDILNAWIDNYWGNLPLPVRQQVIQSPELQGQVVQGFSQLEWSDDQSDAKQSSGQFSPATVDNVARWAKAYGQPAEMTAAFLDGDAELKNAAVELGLPLDVLTPMEVLQAVEQNKVTNRFVPPQIWMDEADKDDSSLVYVGTVLNCELLTDVSGDGEDPCALGGAGSSVFSEGASDTSTYPHFAVPNGGQVTHRRFDVVGPENFGPDSTISVRVTHGAVEDMVFLAHVPSTWEGHPTEDMPYGAFGEWCKAELTAGRGCNARTGILLKAPATGSVNDGTFTWRLGDVCEFDGDTAVCPVGVIDENGAFSTEDMTISTWANRGRITVTFRDLGGDSATELDNCAACTSGGGHANQILVTLQ